MVAPLSLRVEQEAQQRPLRPPHLLGEARVAAEPVESRHAFDREELLRPIGRRVRRVLRVAAVDAQRPAVGRDLLDVEEAHTVVREDGRHREEREVREVLVVDGVELVVLA